MIEIPMNLYGFRVSINFPPTVYSAERRKSIIYWSNSMLVPSVLASRLRPSRSPLLTTSCACAYILLRIYIWWWWESLWIYMVFDDDDENPYEFIWFLTMMMRIPMNFYVFWRWWWESLWIYMVFGDDDENPYEFIEFVTIIIRIPMNLYGFWRWCHING